MKNKLINTLMISILLSFHLNALADGSEASANASASLSVGVGSVVLGSASLVAISGQMLVESVEKTADGVVLILKSAANGTSEAAKISVNVGGNASGAASVVVGQSVEVVAETVGSAIVASGKVIAFIPNEIGQSLMHHSRLDDETK